MELFDCQANLLDTQCVSVLCKGFQACAKSELMLRLSVDKSGYII